MCAEWFKVAPLPLHSPPPRIEATRDLCNALKDHVLRVEDTVTKGAMLRPSLSFLLNSTHINVNPT